MEGNRILLLVSKNGYSFVNQARALAKGLDKLNLINKIIRIGENYPEKEILEFAPSVVVGIGAWRTYTDIVSRPQEMGLRVLPWLVSDDTVDKFVNELNALDSFLVASNYCKSVYVKYGVRQEKMTVMHEAVDPDFWKKIPDAELNNFLNFISVREEGIEVPANYDLVKVKKDKIPVLFTTGGDATKKGAREILKALSLLDPKIPWIYIIKTWPSPNSFKLSAEELQIAIGGKIWGKVRYFSGEFSAEFMRNLMNVCDIYVACSHDEGFGLPLVEAQMCGKPVVTMKGTATGEVVEDGVGGLYCKSTMTTGGPKADINDLSSVLKTLITDVKLRMDLGENGRRWAISKFAPEKIASELITHIDNMHLKSKKANRDNEPFSEFISTFR